MNVLVLMIFYFLCFLCSLFLKIQLAQTWEHLTCPLISKFFGLFFGVFDFRNIIYSNHHILNFQVLFWSLFCFIKFCSWFWISVLFVPHGQTRFHKAMFIKAKFITFHLKDERLTASIPIAEGRNRKGIHHPLWATNPCGRPVFTLVPWTSFLPDIFL